MRNDRTNIIVDLSFGFALQIIQLTEKLEKDKKYVVSRQLLKSGTSIGANIREAQNAESKLMQSSIPKTIKLTNHQAC